MNMNPFKALALFFLTAGLVALLYGELLSASLLLTLAMLFWNEASK